MSARRTFVFMGLLLAVASISGFAAGVFHARQASAAVVAEVKQELTREMGLIPVGLVRQRRSSFLELHAYDADGTMHYGTAGYLGAGYFITVKHAVTALDPAKGPGPVSVKLEYRGEEIEAELADAGDATVEVHSGDWAILRSTKVDLPPLHVDTSFSFDFAAPIFRLGNDYSRGILVSNGYIGARTSNGLVTCLVDGHPGVSGGGILDQRGDLVGIPVGRMDGDYRFSFLLPIRREMLRKVPHDLS